VRPSGWQLAELSELISEGALHPHLEEVYPLARAADAMDRLEQGRVRGKLVLGVE
jgi:NADPH:quinone reductase-like Zn-dependent oxidoreductase